MTREEAIDILKNAIVRFGRTNGKTAYAEALQMAIKTLEQPERKTGKWILVEESIKVAAYKCSECGRTVWTDKGYDVMKDYPFCHCGADMRGGRE